MEKNVKILALETSGSACGISLSERNRILAETTYHGHNLHDRVLARAVKRILGDFDLSANNLDAVAVSSGPGSFTGLRIGSAVAKGLCFGDNPKLIAVPTLKALALAADETAKSLRKDKIMVAIAAYQDIFYLQEYDFEGNESGKVIIDRFDNIKDIVSKNVFICGPGAPSFPAAQTEEFNKLSVRFVSNLAIKMFHDENFADAIEFTPNYVQAFVPRTGKKS